MSLLQVPQGHSFMSLLQVPQGPSFMSLFQVPQGPSFVSGPSPFFYVSAPSPSRPFFYVSAPSPSRPLLYACSKSLKALILFQVQVPYVSPISGRLTYLLFRSYRLSVYSFVFCRAGVCLFPGPQMSPRTCHGYFPGHIWSWQLPC